MNPYRESPVVLTILNGDERGRVVVVATDSRVVLGRGEDADIQLSPADARLSRRHARLEPSAAGWRLCHEPTARNVTQVNGLASADSVLSDGDEIRLGDTLIRVSLPTSTPATFRCHSCGADLSR